MIIKEQIIEVRDTGLTNMFDARMVQKIANDLELYELVDFIKEHRKEYAEFILYGDESVLDIE